MHSGQTLAGRYRLDEPIATGGMGEVWRATDGVLGRTVAVKILRADQSADASFGARFRAEARMLATLHHPGVVDIYDYGEISSGPGSPEVAYLVMAFVDGEPLSHRLDTSGRLSPAATMSIVAQTADALHAAHTTGIVHRDVKPGNVLIDAHSRAILVDFGIAHTADTDGLTGVRDVLGTARYMAPEQATKRTLTPATDVYALGTLAYECLAGTPPFPGNDVIAVAMAHVYEEPPDLPADVPVAVRDVVMTAMAKDPTQRFPTAAAMATAARRAAGPRTAAIPAAAMVPANVTTARFTPSGQTPANGIALPAAPVPPKRRPKRGIIAAVASLAIVGIAIAVVLAAFHPGTSGTTPPPQPTSTAPAGAGPGPSGVPRTSGANGRPTPSGQSSGAGHSGKPGATTTTKKPTAPAPSTTPPSTGSPTGGTAPSAAPSPSSGGGDTSGGGGTTGGAGTSGGGAGGTTPTPTPSPTG
jgi:eukaryotic-like serine/threonine-protein kinase